MLNIKPINYASNTRGEEFVASLHETGFALIKGHEIHPDSIQNMMDEWGAFFASDEKFDYLRDIQRQDGYFPFKSENAKNRTQKDLKEFYHIYPWGRIPDKLKATTKRFYDSLFQMGLTLLRDLENYSPNSVAKGFKQPLEDMMQGSQQSLLRVLHYPPLEEGEEEGAIRAAAHEDINLITLLVTGSAPGLQAKDSAGQWHDIPCDPDMVTVNSGDMLALASHDYFPSTTHRVVNPDQLSPNQATHPNAIKQSRAINQSRYSLPLFIHPRGDAVLKDKITADSYLQERLNEIGLISTK